MPRGPLFQSGYSPRLSGHETFPLRYGWLKKAFDAIEKTEGGQESKSVFLSEDAIARFGVGKNMVASMRHWAEAIGVIEEKEESGIQAATLGLKLFGAKGLDPYMEHPATLWLIHRQLAARPEKTTWFWAFNYYPDIAFDREHLVRGLQRLAKDRAWSRAAGTTIKNDVACFIRTYVPQQSSKRGGHDDALESPLAELGLIKATGKRDGFHFVRGPKPSLGNGVFVYALLDFWNNFSPKASTLSFEAIVHEPGSPGRVFLLDENDVVDRLATLGAVTNGACQWSETASLKQVVRSIDLDPKTILDYVDMDYAKNKRRAAA